MSEFYQPNLTPKEKEFTRYLLKGLSNKEIGEKMGIAIRTVKRYANLVFIKMGVSNREELVAICLLPLDSPMRAHIEAKNKNVY